MSQPELVIFDCDGVLVDSEIIAARVEADLISGVGFPITAAEIAESYAGLTFKDMLVEIEARASIPLPATLIDQAEKLIDDRLKREVRAIEGAAQAALSLASPYCICSNSRLERIEFSLARAGLKAAFPVERIFSARDIPGGRTKPAPDVFLHAMKTLGAAPENTFVIEDSVHGVNGARAAGTRVIGFTGGSHSYPGHADVLIEAGAETVISRWRDFPGILAALAEFTMEL